jgi:error-prone DNA polymerase
LADGDAFGSLGVNRRDALWTIKGLSDEVMPLFAAADERDRVIRSEAQEPAVALTPMTEGREVVEDSRSKAAPASPCLPAGGAAPTSTVSAMASA